MCAYFILKCLALTACSILPKEMTGPRTRRLGDVFGRWRRFVFLSKHSVLCFFGTHASLVKPKNRLHRLKSSSCHPEYQYTGTEVLILSCVTADCSIPITDIAKRSDWTKNPKAWRRFRSMETIIFLIQTFCSLFFWNACKFR